MFFLIKTFRHVSFLNKTMYAFRFEKIGAWSAEMFRMEEGVIELGPCN